jgi:hypothetical protein
LSFTVVDDMLEWTVTDWDDYRTTVVAANLDENGASRPAFGEGETPPQATRQRFGEIR